ncbi:MAG: hypothetical protein AMXMBFR13_39340 [Phycisphaerae bacterium]
MRRAAMLVVLVMQVAVALPALGQVVMSGRLVHERVAGGNDMMPLTAVLFTASLDGPGSEARAFRTFEMEPAGWYFLPGSPGNYTMMITTPAGFVRPTILTNIYMADGQKVDRPLSPSFDFAHFSQSAWDSKAASHYFQTFVAKGTSVTHVGFKVVHDGVDGIGPGAQNLLVSIHRKGDGTPDNWEQVGPTMPVLQVDSGGPKDYTWSAGWNSGEVPTKPGETYAVHLRAENPDGKFQAWWRPDEDQTTDCYRIGEAGKTGWQNADLWMAVDGDGDGLKIPYNKRVHRHFVELTHLRKVWSQTYVAQGRGLAGVVLYMATSGIQPGITRQRAIVRVRQGGPEGKVVGIEKIAIGNGNFTGDASWGMFCVAYAPGEVSLTPGQTYCLEFESLENIETLHGYVNIKGMVSDDRPGFNPYKKAAPDVYENGQAFMDGSEPQDFDLDMQIVEYERPVENWARAVHEKNLLVNGDMERGELDDGKEKPGRAEGWGTFAVEPATRHTVVTDLTNEKSRVLRVLGGSATGKPADGGFVQRVEGLSRFETYRVSGQVRCSWPMTHETRCRVGLDPTGQTDDPNASTIQWTKLPAVHGIFVPYGSEPVRPEKESISVWLRGETKMAGDYPFRADFDDFALQRVRTDVPEVVR